MTTMLQRVCNALEGELAKSGSLYAEHTLSGGQTHRFNGALDLSGVARAALLAMREPDSETVLAGEATGDQYEGCDPEECWPAMIDAILKG